jgi:predicted porin
MKKSLIALAVLGGFTGMAVAQSSVTLFGTLDVNARWVKNDGGGNRKTMGTDGINSSAFGVRGIEDLGGGLRAGFHLESAVNPDTGTSNATRFWHRRATVSLLGGFGEVRLGRHLTPSFLSYASFDPFGTNGVGNAGNVHFFGGQITAVRSDNAFQYFLPSNIGGVYGNVMVAPGEGAAGKLYGGRVGFAGGPFNVSVGYSQQDVVPGGADKWKAASVGGSWNFGFATLMGFFNSEKIDLVPEQKEKRWLVGATFPLGQGEIRTSFTRSDLSGTGIASNDADQVAVGYVYNLSKRTALYATGSRINNKGTRATAIPGGPGLTPGGKSNGIEGGIRHFF